MQFSNQIHVYDINIGDFPSTHFHPWTPADVAAVSILILPFALCHSLEQMALHICPYILALARVPCRLHAQRKDRWVCGAEVWNVQPDEILLAEGSGQSISHRWGYVMLFRWYALGMFSPHHHHHHIHVCAGSLYLLRARLSWAHVKQQSTQDPITAAASDQWSAALFCSQHIYAELLGTGQYPTITYTSTPHCTNTHTASSFMSSFSFPPQTCYLPLERTDNHSHKPIMVWKENKGTIFHILITF